MHTRSHPVRPNHRVERSSTARSEARSEELYQAIRRARASILESLRARAPSSATGPVEAAQRIVDRVVLLCLFEDRALVPKDIFRGILSRPRPRCRDDGHELWGDVRALFRALRRDAPGRELGPAGDLFADDSELEAARLENRVVRSLAAIARFDFKAELDVEVLGRVLERSIGDLEAIRAAAQPHQRARGGHARRRKRDGVYYTPAHITDHIVREALGRWFEERRRRAGLRELPPLRSRARPQHIAAWRRYRDALRRVRVLDPACGAGAFLCCVFACLHDERLAVERELLRLGAPARRRDPVAHILAHNLYGVDKSGEGVALARLSLWLKAAGKNARPAALAENLRVGDSLVSDPAVVDGALDWARTFPEIARDGGFDVIVGNPPYDVLARRELGRPLTSLLRYIADDEILSRSARGKHNLYKLFTCRCLALLRDGGRMSMIVPMSLMGDQQALEVRRFLFEQCTFERIDAFPQKDRVNDRVFRDAKQSTVVFVVRKGREPAAAFPILVHPGRGVETPESAALRVSEHDVRALAPGNLTLPACDAGDWQIIRKILADRQFRRLGEVAEQRQGEVNETSDGACTTTTPTAYPILRGANITRYAVREASQGVVKYLKRDRFLARKRAGTKAFDYRDGRVGFQRSAPQNNYRRLIAAPLGRDVHCFDTVSYIAASSSRVALDVLLALLNSQLYEWWFRALSTNSKINKYQFAMLPFLEFTGARGVNAARPLLASGRWREAIELLRQVVDDDGAPTWSVELFAAMARRIHRLERRRIVVSRRQRAYLGPTASAVQELLDQAIFTVFRLTDIEVAHVRRRLER